MSKNKSIATTNHNHQPRTHSKHDTTPNEYARPGRGHAIPRGAHLMLQLFFGYAPVSSRAPASEHREEKEPNIHKCEATIAKQERHARSPAPLVSAADAHTNGTKRRSERTKEHGSHSNKKRTSSSKDPNEFNSLLSVKPGCKYHIPKKE